MDILRIIGIGLFLAPIFLHGSSPSSVYEISDIRSLTQAVAIHAVEHNDQVTIPYEKIAGVRTILKHLDTGIVVFAPHENYIFPKPSAPAVPIVFYERDLYVIVGFSDFSTQYYRLSDPPEGYSSRRIPSLSEVGHLISFIVSPALNILLLTIIVLMWRPRMK